MLSSHKYSEWMAAMPWDDRIERRLKLKDLRALMAVIDEGGMGKAADRLNYSQPAVSQAIANLERTIGKRLMERGRRGIELTAYGEALLKCGVAVFDDLRKGVEEIDFLADPTAGEVRIACTEPVSAGIVSEVINRLVPRYPRIEFSVLSRENEIIYRELDARRVDLVIAQITDVTIEDHMQKEVIYDEAVVVVAGTGHPCARKRHLKLADLADEPWALPPRGTFVRKLLTDAFHANGLQAPRIAVTALPQVRMMLAANGRLLTIVPDVMLQVGARHLSIKGLPIELPANRRPVAIVTLKNRSLNPVAQLFIEHARAVAKAIANVK
jgi:DNA-binding transcriptional LysR family regulator